MPLDLRLDGEVIASVDEQVTGVRIQTARGQTSATGIAPHEGVVDIILDRVAPSGPIRLDQLEAMQAQAIQDRGEEGQPVGFLRDAQVHPSGLRASQGVHDETLREGGVDKELAERTRTNTAPPSRDLASGLSPKDTDVLTARIEAFGQCGDAEKAIEDNPPTDPNMGTVYAGVNDKSSEKQGRSGDGASDSAPLGGPSNQPPPDKGDISGSGSGADGSLSSDSGLGASTDYPGASPSVPKGDGGVPESTPDPDCPPGTDHDHGDKTPPKKATAPTLKKS